MLIKIRDSATGPIVASTIQVRMIALETLMNLVLIQFVDPELLKEESNKQF